MNTPVEPSSKMPAYGWMVAGVLLALAGTQGWKWVKGKVAEERRGAAVAVDDRIDSRSLAETFYLRFLQDESGGLPQERQRRAVENLARSKKLPVDKVRTALEEYAGQVENDPNRSEYATTVAAAIRGRYGEALKPLERPASSTTTGVSDPLEGSLLEFDGHFQAHRWAEAERVLTDLRRRFNAQREPEAWARIQTAAFNLRFTQERLGEAESLAREALQIRERVLPPESPGLANALHNLGVVYSAQHRDEEAAGLHRRALAIYEKAYGPNDLEVAKSCSELAGSLADTDRRAEGEAPGRRAMALYEQAGPDFELPMALACDRVGFVLLYDGRFAEAEAVLRKAVSIYDRHPDARVKNHSDALHRLGLAIAKQDRRREGVALLKRSTEVGAKWFREDDPLYAVYFHNLAVWADGAGDDPLTVEGYTRALRILALARERTGQRPTQMSQSEEFYTAYLRRSGVPEGEVKRRLLEAERGR